MSNKNEFKKYKEFLDKVYHNYVLHKILQIIFLFLLIFTASLFLAALFDLPVILLLTLVSLITGFLNFPKNKENFLRFLEKKYPSLKNKLVIPYQIHKKTKKEDDIAEKIIEDSITYIRKIPHFWRKNTIFYFSACCGTMVLFFYLFFSMHLKDFYSSLLFPQKIKITVKTDKYYMKKNDTLSLMVSINSDYRFKRIKLIENNRSKIIKLNNNKVNVRENLSKDTKMFVQLHSVKKGPLKLRVLSTPEFLSYKWTIKLPSGKERIVKTKNIWFYRGSYAKFYGKTKESFDSAIVIYKKKNEKKRIKNVKENDVVQFDIKDPEQGNIVITLFKGKIENKKEFNFIPYKDNPPIVEIYYPAMDIDIPLSMKLLIKGYFIDDLGISSIYFVKAKNDSIVSKKRIYFAKTKEDTVVYLWNFENEDLMPGEEFTYWLDAIDISGNKSKSSKYRVRFPGLDEIYSEVSKTSGTIENRLQDVSKKQKGITEKIEKMKEKLERKRELTPEDFERVKQLINEQQQALQDIYKTKELLSQAEQKMKNGILYNPETMEKLQELKEMIEKNFPESLKKQLDTLNIKPDLKNINKTLEELLNNQEMLKKRIERAIELLKQVRQFENLKNLSKKLENLIEKQKQALSNLKNEDIGKFKEKEESIKKDISELKNDSLPPFLSQNLNEVENYLNNSLNSFNKNTMMKWGEQSLQSMQNMLNNLNEMMASLEKENNKENIENLKKVAQDMAFLEQEMEELKKEENLKQLEETKRALSDMGDSLYSLSKKIKKFNPVIYENIYEAMKNIENAMGDLKRGNMTRKNNNINNGINKLNKSLIDIASLLQSMKEGESCENPQNQSMSPAMMGMMQMEINQEMLSLPLPLPMPIDKTLSNKLNELMQKQEALRKMLEEYMKENEDAGFSSLLKEIAEEMKKVEEEIYKKNINRKLIERQRGIVSRLLEAEKSIRKRGTEGYEREIGKNRWNESPPKILSKNLGDRKKELRMLIYREMQKNMPEEFEPYVKMYFEELLKE